ncbi:MAG: DUF4190 and DUF4352 domain-containing protein [Lachnospiraceae bacterium]|nr:DUF4190 and DUF4352 domain-containing protein [Lachnospiraceae bacterium]
MGVASLVLGIIAIATSWKVIGIIPGILSIIFGIIALVTKKDKMGLVGIILSVVGLLSAAVIFGIGIMEGLREVQTPSGNTIVADNNQTTITEEESTFSWGELFGQSSEEEEEETGVKKNKDGKKFYVGDVVEGSNWKVTYLNKGVHINDNEFYEQKPNTKIVYIEVEVENISGSDQIVASTSFDCYADGYECDWYCNLDEDLSATLSPGRKSTGKAFFVVPDNAKEIEFEFSDDIWKDKKILFVYQE